MPGLCPHGRMELCAGGKSSMQVLRPETAQAEGGESMPTHREETGPPKEAESLLQHQTRRMCAQKDSH